MANFTLKSVHVGDVITPQSIPAERHSKHQRRIYEENRTARVKILAILRPGTPESAKAFSAASGKPALENRTWWVRYHRVNTVETDGKKTDIEDTNDRFFSNHDLVTYFGYSIPGASGTGVKTVRVF